MAYSAEVVRRARQRLASEKADRESKNQQHLAAAYAQVPRIKEIDGLLRQSMALAAKAAFTKGSDPVAAMEQVKQANLALQQERKALIEANFPAGYIDESPICERCGGSGYLGSTMCACLQELCRQEQKKEIAVLAADHERFENFRLDYYSDQVNNTYHASPRRVMERIYKVCLQFAQGFGPGSGNLLFVGATGLGKTFLSACIARVVADKGCSVAYESASHLFSKLEKNRFNPTEETHRDVAKLMDCDLLIIDDLGTELPGSFVTAALYSLVNDRLLAGKPMVVSTNLTMDEMSQRYSPQIVSRFYGSFRRLVFVGEDIRVLKSKRLI